MKALLAAGLLACAVGAAGSCEGGPRAPVPRVHAKPSLEGTWRVNFLLPMEATPQTPALIVSEQQARALAPSVAAALSAMFVAGLDPEYPELARHSDGLAIVRGQRRTRAVVLPTDGRLPYTASARKEAESPPPPDTLDNPEQRPNGERCLVGSGQPPLSSFTLDSQLQIVRTPDAVVLHTEYGDDIRVVRLSGGHAPPAFRSRMGDSIGHWEGSTLVVETIGLPDDDRVRIGPVLIVPGEGTVIERLTPVSDRELLYQFTVVDRKTYAAPWLAEFSWFRTDMASYEHACHEGNYSLPNVLAGARHEEAVARAVANGQIASKNKISETYP